MSAPPRAGEVEDQEVVKALAVEVTMLRHTAPRPHPHPPRTIKLDKAKVGPGGLALAAGLVRISCGGAAENY
jgi:hypothetical protein